MDVTEQPLQFALKIAARCNLDCTYCYVYNKGDTTWKERPAIMPEEVFGAVVERIRAHCMRTGQDVVRIVFHGGEPCLVGVERFRAWCARLRERVGGITRLQMIMQTNGTLLDREWARLLAEERVNVGISIDGPREVNDLFRIDHRGHSSYDNVVRGIRHLREADQPVALLTVLQFDADPVAVHRHLVELGAYSIEYILPDYTHDTIAEVRKRYGPTPCADYLIAVFDEWWRNGTLDVAVGPFQAIARAILGGEPNVDYIGNNPFGFLFIETDGAIEGLDVLRVCANGMAASGVNVIDNDVTDIARVSRLHQQSIFDGIDRPTMCAGCPEADTCSGGYLPHRYSAARGFDNPSVWCADLLALFAHIRERLDVPYDETRLRRLALHELAQEAIEARGTTGAGETAGVRESMRAGRAHRGSEGHDVPDEPDIRLHVIQEERS